MVYVLDTSSARNLWPYYEESFPTLWTHLDRMISRGELITVREAKPEFDRNLRRDWLEKWFAERSNIFCDPLDEEGEVLSEIFKNTHFEGLVAQSSILRAQPSADAFLIACAKVRNGTVISEEIHKLNSAKIPTVCHHFGVNCTNLRGFFVEMGWKF